MQIDRRAARRCHGCGRRAHGCRARHRAHRRSRVEQLLAQVRRGVDQHARRAAGPRRSTSSEQRRRRFVGFARIAGAPAVADARHAARRAAAEDREPSGSCSIREAAGRGTFENNRKKFSVVWRAIVSTVTPLHLGEHLRRVRRRRPARCGLPRYGSRREIRRVGLDEQAVGRHCGGHRAQISSAFLKVIMPENDT